MSVNIPFCGPSYQARSMNADAQQTLNCYVEMDSASPRAPLALYGTPGLNLEATLPQSPVRGVVAEGGLTWWIAYDSVYRVDGGANITLLGKISSRYGEVGMVSNGTQILIVDGVGGYLINVPAATLTKIDDVDFPNGVRRCTFQDGYFIVTGLPGSQSFYINSAPFDGGNWDALDFASAEGATDNTVGIISDHRELWLFGPLSAEVWVNTGSTDFPFQRSGNTFIEHGCVAAGTIAKADNAVFWLGSDERGSGIVWRANGYTPQRISTHATEAAFAKYTLTDAFAFAYEQEGHAFYVLTFPTSNKTWVYDAATQLWHERAWREPLTGVLHRWRPSCYVFAYGALLVGDYESGKIYSLKLDVYLDNGVPILRRRRAMTTAILQNRVFYSSLQVDMETGVGTATGQGADPQLMLRFSNDGGHTWSNEKLATVGKVGQYGARAKYNRLGAGRNRVWEISMTDPVKFAVIGAVVDAEPGTS